MTVWLGVFLIGGVGAVCRMLVDRVVSRHVRIGFPIGTFTVNISGAWLLGLLSTLALGPNAALLAGTAFVGAYTTFSTWMLETQRLAEDARRLPAALNIVLSVGVGLLAVWLGQLTGAHLRDG
ncbi:MAG: fluoride efflux transporter CrcB [Mycolicibacterium neoaurum]|uniref:fluoride efflux transporter CrcB n=1 Tax=Mycolicibacterium neoaurum TaxID=1795 RepID=UPI002FF89542